MQKLFLFDIDNTLITSEHDNRFEKTIDNLHDIETEILGDFQGLTDYLVFTELLKGEGWKEEQIVTAMPALLKELDSVHATTFKPESIVLLPGVAELLAALEHAGCTIGLITGNMEVIAERKLRAANIWQYFQLGGYGSDPHKTRADLVTIAVERAGYQDKIADVYVIGDTARDVKAAHDAGVQNSVGVANGFRDVTDLDTAKIVLTDFIDTDHALSMFGVEH